jgi:hypothetical protein
MSLEDPDVVDIITTPAPGKLQLVICDAGVTTDPRERLNKLLAKLRSYVGYLLSNEFATEHPDLGPDDVSIGVVCSTPPTLEMLQWTHVRPRVDPPRLIAVHFSLFDGTTTTPLKPDEPEAPARDKILPRLVTQAFLDRIPEDSPLPHRALDDTGLFVAYVEDGEHSVRFIMGTVADELGLSEYELNELALENLSQTVDMQQVVRRALAEAAITCIKARDSFDAARVLLIPNCLQPGEVLAALVPDRDTLTLVWPPRDGNWAPLAELAKVPASDHLLLDRPLQVTCEGFEVI